MQRDDKCLRMVTSPYEAVNLTRKHDVRFARVWRPGSSAVVDIPLDEVYVSTEQHRSDEWVAIPRRYCTEGAKFTVQSDELDYHVHDVVHRTHDPDYSLIRACPLEFSAPPMVALDRDDDPLPTYPRR
jgi:hypothetical protein